MAKQAEASSENGNDEFYTHSDPQSIKYRIVGAAIILLSCSFAWWALLDHESKRYESIDAIVKEPLNIERFEIPLDVIQKQQEFQQRLETSNQASKPGSSDPTVVKQNAEQHADSGSMKVESKDVKHTHQLTSKKPKASASSAQNDIIKSHSMNASSSRTDPNLADAWVLQLGSFTDKNNADALRQKLYKSDIPAYVKRFDLSGRSIYRVIVGPKFDRRSVEKMQSSVRKKSGIQPLIVKFTSGFEQ